MEYRITVDVALTVEVDAATWAEAYGLAFATTGPDAAALREDIEGHVREIAKASTREAVGRLGAGAVLR